MATLKATTVELVDDDGDPRCAGVWVGNDLIVTANHCVPQNMQPRVKPSDGDEPIDAELVARDADHDLALLRVAPPRPHPFAVPSPAREVGLRLSCVGHTAGMLWTYSEATLAAVRTDVGPYVKGTALHVVGWLWKGHSGGGCFAPDGTLAGVTSFINGAPGHAFLVDATHVQALVSRAR